MSPIGKSVSSKFRLSFREKAISLSYFYRQFDLDGSGAIDKHELKTALSSFGTL